MGIFFHDLCNISMYLIINSMRLICLVDFNVDKFFWKELLDLKLNCLTFYNLHAENQKVENVWKNK